MFVLKLKGLAYSVVVVALLVVAGFAAVGVARTASAQTEPEEPNVCQGTHDAIAALIEASGVDDISPFEEDAFGERIDRLVNALEEALAHEEDGEVRRALALKRGVLRRLHAMIAETTDAGNEPLTALLQKAAESLASCVTQPAPRPVPGPGIRPLPTHEPLAGLVYSSKFVCGRKVSREKMQTENFGKHPFLFEEEEHLTEINIHNYSDSPVTFWTKAVVARPQDKPRGKVSRRVKETLGPNEAMSVNCRNIKGLLSPEPTPHEVCQGKEEAQLVLKEALGLLTTATSTDGVPGKPIERLIAALEKAKRLEREGALRKALIVERGIVAGLDKLIARAEEQGREELTAALQEARGLVVACLRTLADDLGLSDQATDADLKRDRKRPSVVDGFVAIETRRELEVTAVYRAKTHNKTVSGGVGSGVSIDVEQIRPHRIKQATTDQVDAEVSAVQ